MKLIIDTTDDEFNMFRNAVSSRMGNSAMAHIVKGIPLDDVKTEIKTFTITEKSEYDTGFNDAVLKCFNVLDNIGKESEVKPNEMQ